MLPKVTEMSPVLSVREIEERDIPSIVSYWIDSSPEHLTEMGVDLGKVPSAEELAANLKKRLGQSYEEKQSYCMIWEVDGQVIGHNNVGEIKYGDEALMHLHIWKAEDRRRGLGMSLIKLSLPYFFKNLKLKNLFCEPYALNHAPNKTIEKIGFEFVKEYETIPGSLNCLQPVKRWVLTKARFEQLFTEV